MTSLSTYPYVLPEGTWTGTETEMAVMKMKINFGYRRTHIYRHDMAQRGNMGIRIF